MKFNFPEIYADNEIIRYQFRANHIYILMSGLINLVVGMISLPGLQGWRRIFSRLASLLLLISPVLLITAFFVEPVQAVPTRPLTTPGIFILLFGVLSLYVLNLKVGKRT